MTKQFGEQIVLNGLTAEFRSGETVGLVGANGCGKTTLFRIITGELEADTGEVICSKSVKIGYLAQSLDLGTDTTLEEEVTQAFAGLYEMERRLEAMAHKMAAPDAPDSLMHDYDRIRSRFESSGGFDMQKRLGEVLGGLGFIQSDWSLPMTALSGGQRCRAALAKLLLEDQSFLLLDEPTNHLDIDAVRWLEKYLSNYRGGAIIISHDRYLLDHVVDRIVEVEGGRATGYAGGYSTYLETRANNQLTAERQFEKDQAFIAKEQAFINKHMASQRTKEAQGRRTRLERRKKAGEFVTEVARNRKGVKLNFDGVQTDGSTVLRVDDIAKAFDGREVLKCVRFQIQGQQRFGITGPNGVGKSTLLKIVMDELALDSGTFEWDTRGEVGYYAQDTGALDPKKTALECIHDICPDLNETQKRSLLGRFHFYGEDVFKTVNLLSGGERSRIRLLRLILSNPSVLVLDEPTNHLDIPSREALEEALSDFPGTLIVVSHDRYFLDQIVNHLLVLRPGGHEVFDGNYSDYVRTWESRRADTARKKAVSKDKAAQNQAATKQQNSSGSGHRKSSKYDSLSIEQIEAQILELEEKIEVLNERFGDPKIYKDPEAARSLKAELEEVKTELEEAEECWSDRADTMHS